jgi:hypothetical protein
MILHLSNFETDELTVAVFGHQTFRWPNTFTVLSVKISGNWKMKRECKFRSNSENRSQKRAWTVQINSNE